MDVYSSESDQTRVQKTHSTLMSINSLIIICHACLLLSRSVGCGVRALKRMQPCVAVVVIVVTA